MEGFARPFPPSFANGSSAAGIGIASLGPELGDLPLDIPLGIADQACKECRRRKAKCNRAIPTCNLCVKYRRHCLYEKHSRTPLTRKHLTEVEERLERAEALVRQLRSLLPPHLRGINSAPQTPLRDEPFDFTRLDQSFPPSNEAPQHDEADGTGDIQAQADRLDENPQYGPELEPPSASPGKKVTERRRAFALAPAVTDKETSKGVPNILESPPIAEDFEWDERVTLPFTSVGSESPQEQDDGASVVDGMASLTVSEKQGGYLGVASGAALLRILEPSLKKSSPKSRPLFNSNLLTTQPNPNRHIADTMIDAYFRIFHLSYPIVHEPTFRAQYSQVISRPHGDSWLVLAYVVAAIGVFNSATSMDDNLDLGLFAQARSILSFNFLEIGNLTLVQALTLIANYLQKRDRPNSGYNTLGIAVRMAMGLGLHKEFQGWNISPLSMEIRRRVWWSLCVFDSGATITFGRPLVWPFEGIEVSLPMNVDDRDLTPISQSYPPESKVVTPYTAVAAQAKFHLATNAIYARVISKPLPSAEEVLRLDEELLDSWLESIPAFFREDAPVPERYAFAKDALQWRYRNIRVIMYRPFVIRKALHARDGRRDDASPETMLAYERCLEDAKITIASIRGYWAVHEHNRLGAWYALYYIFQAALIPCICLRNDPASPQASDWREQIATTLQTIASLASVTPSAGRCHQVISELCGRYLDAAAATPMSTAFQQTDGSQDDGPLIDSKDAISLGGNSPYVPDAGQVSFDDLGPIDESPQTQINSVFTMMWPNVPPMEAADLVMGEDAWMDFLMGEGAGDDSNVNLDNDGLGML